MGDFILEMNNVSKEFKRIRSLDGINLSFQKNEIHSIVGSKGSGKSTIVKILGGFYPHCSYQGNIVINGQIQNFNKPKDSEKAGISIVFQDMNLIEEMSVFENIFLGSEISRFGFISWKKECAKTIELLKKVGLKTSPSTKLSLLSDGEQQLVKIAKAISKASKILIFDEPAIGLTKREMENFIELLKSMKNNGITSIYLSHELNEVLNFSDRITVLKDGKVICSEKNENLNEQWVMSNMSGRKLDRAQNIDIFLKEKGITEREKEIIFSVMKGLSNKEISDNLFISVNTVKTHIANVYQKMGVSQRMDLANLFKGMI
jgi:ABC-type sugar transport system ATPase subunit